MKNKRTIGSLYEKLAGEYLEKRGYTILEYNYRTRYSEIDIIAKDKNTIVFCEVKFRSEKSPVSALSAVTPAKQRRISCAALRYIYEKNILEGDFRFDVIAIAGKNIYHVKNAFEYKGN